jgi:hypothetical protein
MVALVPEGLPATLPVSLAIGVRRIAQRAALIRSWLPWRRWDRGPTPPGLPAHPTCPAQAAPYSRKRLPQYGFQVSRIPAKAIQGCGAASLASAPRNRSAGLAIPSAWCGRVVLYCCCQASAAACAAGRSANGTASSQQRTILGTVRRSRAGARPLRNSPFQLG